MADRIRANPFEAKNLATSQYVATSTPAEQATCKNTTGCTPALMAQNDRFEWNATVSSTLPSGTGSIAADGATRIFTITVNWDDDRDGDVDGDDPNFQMSFQI
jgi:type IV pilus assembly protein PilV